ncbi:diacylglycerol kinase [Rhodovulum sp. NI22]|uniref:Diacylglycerol kinase n=1 Tax=Actibacterium naphthalenivorans TaxID=1614693 RepID=A0A840C9Q9_9RHOB|nr:MULTISPECIES: diacylglycerol kinase [Actibacterium]ALG91327.1 diacylglycerol kinase [Actibacterium sp. EMB200-NS6]KGB80614.1 diacylglycerol kinase [Rhodovulum sp. NI22]MBB4022721.1 diacylglycerol kinase [Actibacterium naphthalenivorans]
MKNQSFHCRAGFALLGLRTAWRRERSFRAQTVCAALAIIALIVTGAQTVWWALFLVTISVVLALELVNSALEALIDHLHPDTHPEVGVVKDIAAAAVLVASLGALAVGALFVFALIAG